MSFKNVMSSLCLANTTSLSSRRPVDARAVNYDPLNCRVSKERHSPMDGSVYVD